MSTSRGTCEVRIVDEDRQVEYVLTAPYTAHTAVPSRYSAYGWSEPEPAGVEIDGVVLCTEIVTWCGDYGYSAKPGLDDAAGSEEKAGEWCLEKYADEIQQRVERAANDAAQLEERDWDAERDRRIEREIEERKRRA
jgi:hypothetical protein